MNDADFDLKFGVLHWGLEHYVSNPQSEARGKDIIVPATPKVLVWWTDGVSKYTMVFETEAEGRQWLALQ